MLDVVRQLAEENGVCPRPQLLRMVDETTGRSQVIEVPCRSTRESKCRPCAQRAKRLRVQQCREGWHRDTEHPDVGTGDELQRVLVARRAELEFTRAAAEARADWTAAEHDQAGIDEMDKLISAVGLRGRVTKKDDDQDDDEAAAGDKGRRKRSTRRRQDAPDLPRKRVTDRTVGRVYESRDGRAFRPSMFITLTLPSYGRVREDGTPVDMNAYDYRRAAWDAVHFPALLDRFWQNLRRAEGWNIQYFGSVEPQRRLAPHAHFAARGAIPHATVRAVAAATYHQVWWPPTDTVIYDEDAPQPQWREDAGPDGQGGYVDPDTGQPLPTWQKVMQLLATAIEQQPDRQPEHVLRFGSQIDTKGVLAGTDEASRLIGYLTKYLTKSVAECHQATTPAAAEHHRRMYEALRFTPCSPRCANWLRYGIQPKHARRGQTAGRCKGKVHHAETLGLGGRRVLVSRQWSGKTLADHRWDQAAWVRQVLALGLGYRLEELDDQADGGKPRRVRWERATPSDRDVAKLPRRLLRAIATRIKQRAQLREALDATGPPGADVSATRIENGEAA